ncbi:hypothetical protein CCHR01_17340 [Colletotrichum chrysophilum]|uniref:Uncharacterized protein n=1 Tax=Colletotrichum chrysophilum TaxID=1836956 RepID=A0AAD9A2S6_9PEZI|nr:hypothetical protein CCHR01_17340 [Colletotrichum chrysophilum]
MKKLSAKESTSVFGRPSECDGRRRTQGEGGRRKGAKPTISHRRNKAPGRKGGQKKNPPTREEGPRMSSDSRSALWQKGPAAFGGRTPKLRSVDVLPADPPPEASSQYPAIASRRGHQPLIHARVFPKLTVLQCRPAARKLSACDREELRTGTGTDGARNDTTGTDIRLYVLAQTDMVRQKKLPKEHVANKH